jgi:ABC-type sugar transport system ATPase subunit
VSLVERLGTDTIIELTAADTTLFRFATAEAINVKAGDVVRFGYDPEKVHIF